jgi:hypothetical protein
MFFILFSFFVMALAFLGYMGLNGVEQKSIGLDWV